MARFSKGPWRIVKRTTRAGHPLTEVRDANNDVVAFLYTNGDSPVIVRAPRLLGSLKHLIAITEQFEDQLRPSALAKLNQARALVAEIQP